MGCFFIVDQTGFIAGPSSRKAQFSATKRRRRIGKIMDSKIIVKFLSLTKVTSSRNALWRLGFN